MQETIKKIKLTLFNVSQLIMLDRDYEFVTFSSVYTVDFSNEKNLEIYTAKYYDGKVLLYTVKNKIVPAGTGVVIHRLNGFVDGQEYPVIENYNGKIDQPNDMVPVLNKTMIGYIIEELNNVAMYHFELCTEKDDNIITDGPINDGGMEIILTDDETFEFDEWFKVLLNPNLIRRYHYTNQDTAIGWAVLKQALDTVRYEINDFYFVPPVYTIKIGVENLSNGYFRLNYESDYLFFEDLMAAQHESIPFSVKVLFDGTSSIEVACKFPSRYWSINKIYNTGIPLEIKSIVKYTGPKVLELVDQYTKGNYKFNVYLK